MLRLKNLAAVAAICIGGLADAQTLVSIDFDPNDAAQANVFTGEAAATGFGATQTWNGVSHNQMQAGTGLLVDSTNTLTGVSFQSVLANETGRGSGAFVNAQELGGVSQTYAALMGDYSYIRGTNGTRTVTISGLIPASTYDLYLYGQGDQTSQFSGFTIGAERKVTSYDPGAPAGNDGLLAEGIEYVKFTGVPATAAGQLVIVQDNGQQAASNDFGGWNGFQILGAFAPPPVPLNVQVNTQTGVVTLQNNNSSKPITIDDYIIQTTSATLNAAGWNSLSDQGFDATPGAANGDYNDDGSVNAADYTVWRDNVGQSSAGNLENDPIGGTVGTPHYDQWKTNYGSTGGAAAGWSESGGASASLLEEFFLGNSSKLGSTLAPGQSVALGAAFNPAVLSAGASDGTLTFEYFDRVDNANVVGTVSFVNAAVGATGSAVPEPSTAALACLAIAALAYRRRRS
ncbi:hypothetical protein Pla175_26150 [Pirellulimonas nuda]|uniref:Ice-binding protein C-terminal domain-containing protein n=1 Tax=Pirellulimonas nuda TaxID=2528009 RepID=A0A518DCM4_9BACT|nr:PEP-CTERM sorting domain-containing protein [Pirellulimonas nuda]QDU89228.1 hypothetical protein Pla175_26150 [Pirellulimonas nuda]